MRIKEIALCLIITCIFLSSATPSIANKWKKEPEVISIGWMTHNPLKKYDSYNIFINYLAYSLSDLDISRGRVVFAPTLEKLMDLVKLDVIDVVSETAYASSILIERAGMVPLLIECRDGVREYRSFLLARKDSKINKLQDLKGKKVIFEDRNSTSGYYLPRMYLESQGLKLSFTPYISHPHISQPEGTLAYDFTCQERDVLQAVLDGTADVCAIKSIKWEQTGRIKHSKKAQLRVIGRSNPMPRAFLLCREGLSSEIKIKITEALTDSSNIPFIHKTTAYSPVTAEDLLFLEKLKNASTR